MLFDYSCLTAAEALHTDAWGWVEISETHAYSLSFEYVYYNPSSSSMRDGPSVSMTKLTSWLGAAAKLTFD